MFHKDSSSFSLKWFLELLLHRFWEKKKKLFGVFACALQMNLKSWLSIILIRVKSVSFIPYQVSQLNSTRLINRACPPELSFQKACCSLNTSFRQIRIKLAIFVNHLSQVFSCVCLMHFVAMNIKFKVALTFLFFKFPTWITEHISWDNCNFLFSINAFTLALIVTDVREHFVIVRTSSIISRAGGTSVTPLY